MSVPRALASFDPPRSPRCILCARRRAYAGSVDVNWVLLYYSSIFQFYQEIWRKKLFFGSYVKILCKLYYVNSVDWPAVLPAENKIWGPGSVPKPHICPPPCPGGESRPPAAKRRGPLNFCRFSQNFISASGGGRGVVPPGSRPEIPPPGRTAAGCRPGRSR